MLHLPFLAGVALGAGAIYLLTSKKAKEKLESAKEFACEKFEEGKENFDAIKECIKEKKSKCCDEVIDTTIEEKTEDKNEEKIDEEKK